MALTPTQQAFEQIIRAKRILVAVKDKAGPDALAAAASCFLFLKKIGKTTEVVAPGIEPSSIPSYLPGLKEMKSRIGPLRSFNITLDVQDTPLGELMYEVKDKKLNITVVPKSGEWQEKHLSVNSSENLFDLIVALDTPDALSLGHLSEQHADFLYRTPVLNIDCHPANEHWGRINLVDLTAVSTTEHLFELISQWNRHAIDEDLATALLAGMIAKTRSFRTSNVTPKTLSNAAQLVAMGGRRDLIVQGLWRNRSLPGLKIWGRLLTRLEHDSECGLVWTGLLRQDFLETGADEKGLEEVADELLAYTPEANVFCLFREASEPDKVNAAIFAKPPRSALDLARAFGATGSRDSARFTVKGNGKSFVETTRYILEEIKKNISKASQVGEI